MADKDPRHVDREAEEKRQQEVVDAVEKATHDKDGNPVPIVIPEPAGVKVIKP